MRRVGQNSIYTPSVTVYVGLARTIYIRCTYGIFGLEITKYTVYIYGSGQPYVYVVISLPNKKGVILWITKNGAEPALQPALKLYFM
jgi:hypothetical protein